MSIKDRKCIVCGREYRYCPNCWDDRNKPAYMMEFDCENCKTIFDICSRFNMELNTKEESEELLKKCDLSDKDNFSEQIKKDIANITYTDPNKIEIKKTEESAPVFEYKNKKKNKKNRHEVVTKGKF